MNAGWEKRHFSELMGHYKQIIKILQEGEGENFVERDNMKEEPVNYAKMYAVGGQKQAGVSAPKEFRHILRIWNPGKSALFRKESPVLAVKMA